MGGGKEAFAPGVKCLGVQNFASLGIQLKLAAPLTHTHPMENAGVLLEDRPLPALAHLPTPDRNVLKPTSQEIMASIILRCGMLPISCLPWHQGGTHRSTPPRRKQPEAGFASIGGHNTCLAPGAGKVSNAPR